MRNFAVASVGDVLESNDCDPRGTPRGDDYFAMSLLLLPRSAVLVAFAHRIAAAPLALFEK